MINFDFFLSKYNNENLLIKKKPYKYTYQNKI